MTKHTLRIVGWRPARLNELLVQHWASAGRRKTADALRLLIECQNQKIPLATGRRRVTLLWRLEKGERTPDADGLWKSLLDGLVHAGRLKDDNPKWCETAPVTYERGEVKGIEVVLEDLE